MPHNFPEEERKILKFWEDKQIFEKSLEQTKGKKSFIFFDGPPFATGTPHYGHLLQSAIKDAIPRYKTMQGFYVQRQWGWDCHGLPIENIVEKELGTKSKKDIIEMGVKKFNDLCRAQIFTFINEWERIIPRFGRWADMKNPYRTMDFEYMQSEWWAFKELYKNGLIYEDYRSMHICPRCETTLSQGEVAEGYKDIKDLSATLKFKIKNPEKIGLTGNIYLLAWTTTPWTLPGNVALAVGEKIKYSTVQIGEEKFILASERTEEVLVEKDFKILKEINGKDLIGLEYEPLFDFYAKNESFKNKENGWKVYVSDFVNTEDGTGIVHIAPAFGADDMALGKKEQFPFVQHVKMDGTFREEAGEFTGLDLKPRAKGKPEEIREADLLMVRKLEEKGLLFDSKKYEHSYPHCWRCDTALLNYATSSWFVAVEKIKPILLKTAKKINWSPVHIKEGRFGQWLEGARDWSISRQRFWANTIPVWRCEKCKKENVFASAEELEKASGVKVNDLHKDIVDQITFECDCNGEMQRVPDVLDTWFDSGSVPFATLHYPVENKNNLKKRLPADFIGEAQDQTRAWFYYQHVLVGALFGMEAFKNCIVTGIVLAEDGKKMSKKLKNYPDPSEVMEKYGADAMRFYMMNSPVVQADNLSFSENGVDEIVKKNLSRLYNVLAFYQLYQNETPAKNNSKNLLDVWILSRLFELIETTIDGYESYRIDLAIRPLTDFIDDLSVWYLRRSRDRFKEDGNDKKDALATLRYVLLSLSKVIAPAMPFFAEYLFLATREKDDKESVHLSLFPKKENKKIDANLISQMQEVRNIVNKALSQRIEKAIKVKQPLSSLRLKEDKVNIKNNDNLLNLIKDEVNVREVIFDKSVNSDVTLDINITEELKEEGIMREMIRFIQDSRKSEGLKPGEEIFIDFFGEEKLIDILRKNKIYICKEVRAKDFYILSDMLEGAKEILIDGKKLLLKIKK
jgi:isoleucyl-tRNA synthetase